MRVTELEYRVPYADTDRMGVVYYANYLIYFERIRNEILREAGLPYRILEEQGLMLPVVEAVCRYKAPARYDDMLSLKGWVSEAKGARTRIECEVYKDDELLVSGYTIHAAINVAGRPVRLPETLIALKPDA